MSRMRGCHGLELGRSISPRGGSHVHSEGGGACRARERERDNGDANFDLWAIVSDYGTRRAERERR